MKSMYGTRDAASNWERDLQEHVRNLDFQLGLSSKKLYHHEGNRVSGLTHGDHFVLTWPTKKLVEFERKMTSGYTVNAKIIGYVPPRCRQMHFPRHFSHALCTVHFMHITVHGSSVCMRASFHLHVIHDERFDLPFVVRLFVFVFLLFLSVVYFFSSFF